jgi:hypothetical protein
MSDPVERLPEPDGGAGPEITPPAPEPAPVVVRPSYRAAALALALALIVIGGLVAAAPWWAPLLPWGPQAAREAALGRRLDRLDAAERQAEQRLAQQQSAAVASLQKLGQRVAALETRPAAQPPDLAPLRQEVEKLQQATGVLADRTAAVESAVKAPATAGLEQRVAALESAAKDRADAVAGVDKRLAARSAQIHGTASEATDAGLAVALLRISDALASGRPFAAEYRAIRRLAQGRPDIEQAAAPLADAAANGVASRAALARQLHALAGKVAAAPPAEPAPDGWAAQAWRGLRGLVRIRRADAPAAGPAGIVAAAEKALAGGDLKGAIDDVGKLTGAAAEAARGWLRDARQRLDAEDAVARLKTALARGSDSPGANPATSGPAKAGGGAPG